MTPKQLKEKVKDRRAYRATLIQRINEMEVKLTKVQQQIFGIGG